MAEFILLAIMLCLWATLFSSIIWAVVLISAALMWLFPFVAAGTVGAIAVLAFIAWRRSNGH